MNPRVTIEDEVEQALDFVDAAATAAIALPPAEGRLIRAKLAAARAALVACHAEVRRPARSRPRTGRMRRWAARLGRRFGLRDAPTPARLDLLYGRRAIARYLGLNKVQGRAVVEKAGLPIFKLGGVECARRSSLRRHVRALEEARQ